MSEESCKDTYLFQHFTQQRFRVRGEYFQLGDALFSIPDALPGAFALRKLFRVFFARGGSVCNLCGDVVCACEVSV